MTAQINTKSTDDWTDSDFTREGRALLARVAGYLCTSTEEYKDTACNLLLSVCRISIDGRLASALIIADGFQHGTWTPAQATEHFKEELEDSSAEQTIATLLELQAKGLFPTFLPPEPDEFMNAVSAPDLVN